MWLKMWLNWIVNFDFSLWDLYMQVEERPTSDELTYLEKLWRSCFPGQQASGDQDWSAPLDPTGKETRQHYMMILIQVQVIALRSL